MPLTPDGRGGGEAACRWRQVHWHSLPTTCRGCGSSAAPGTRTWRQGSKPLSIKLVRRAAMGSPSEVTLLRRELANVHRRHDAETETLNETIRQLVSNLSEVTAERDGLRITCRLQKTALATSAGTSAELSERCRRLEEDVEGMRTLLRRHENPNSPTSSRAICHRERDRLRAKIGSYNEGDDGRRRGGGSGGGGRDKNADSPERGLEGSGSRRRGGDSGGAAAGRRGRKKGAESQAATAVAEPAAPSRRRRGPGKSNSTKTECTLAVPLGPSWCCGADYVVIGYAVKRLYDLIGGWLLEFEATNGRGRRLQDLAREAVRIGGVGRGCAVALKLEVGCCSACGLPWKASTPISIPGTALGAIIRERLLDLTEHMSYQDAANYIRWYYGIDVSENAVANAVSASMDAAAHLIPRIVERICANGYAVIDETMARSMGRWAYIVAACSGDAVLITAAPSRSAASLEEALGPIWSLPKVTDEHGAYPDRNRQSDSVHNLRSAEEPVYVWLTLFGDYAEEAGIDPGAEFRAVERAVIPPLVDMIRANPDVRLVDGAELPSVEPADGGGCGRDTVKAIRSILPAASGHPDAAAPLPPASLPRPPRAGDIALKKRGKAAGGVRRPRRGGLAGIIDRDAASGSPPPPPPSRPRSGRRPTAKEIAGYRRDSTTYFGLLCLYRVSSRIDTAPPIVALALQRAMCAILEGYGDKHPVRTRYENAMPCLFYHTQVDGMPAHSNDVERVIRNVAKRYMDAHVQFKGHRGMVVGSGKMTIAANAGRRGMSLGRAVTYAIADPSWNILDGPPAGEPPAWMPPGGGARSSGAG